MTSQEVNIKTIRASPDRQACPEMIPSVDGTAVPLRKGEKPYFVVAAVYFGKPEASLEVVDKAQLDAEVQRIGQFGLGHLFATAGVDKGIELKSEDAVVIAVRPVTVPHVVPFDAFSLRGNDGLLVQWEHNRCVPGADCTTAFGTFAEVIKAWAPEPETLR